MKNTKLILLVLFLLIPTLNFAQDYRVNRTNEKTKAKIKSQELGKNIIAFSPFELCSPQSVTSNSNEILGVGLSYERILENEYIGIKLPLTIAINNPGFIFAPTAKFYPKKQGVVKYSVGPQLVLSMIEASYEIYKQVPGGGGYYTTNTGTQTTFGFGINNCINFTIAKSFYLSLDATLGINYYDSFKKLTNNNYYNSNSTMLPFFKMGTGLGYRF